MPAMISASFVTIEKSVGFLKVPVKSAVFHENFTVHTHVWNVLIAAPIFHFHLKENIAPREETP